MGDILIMKICLADNSTSIHTIINFDLDVCDTVYN